jgi:DNA-binding MarR family transcriptional regulator
MSDFDVISVPLSKRLREGLERVAAVLRADQWAATNGVGLNPTQVHVLTFLAGRDRAGIRVKEIAAHLGVSQPTATDSIAALERKMLIDKDADAQDSRATSVRINAQGRDVLKTIGAFPSGLDLSLSGLTIEEQSDLLLLLVKLIRSMQMAGSIPVQRMCVTCRHFQPNTYSDAQNPHHCAFVNAAFGDRHFRLDCSDHELADPSLQSANWAAFDTGPAALQATQPT